MASRRAAVLGRPIEHSLSPVLHQAAYAALGLDWAYEAIDCGADELGDVVHRRRDWAGFSCTMPLKHAALEVADTVHPLAAAVGSANTLRPTADGWVAENTDVAGVVAALTEHAVTPRTVTVLGAGGTAQAVLAALRTLHLDACTVLVRDQGRAARLLDTAGRLEIAVAVEPLRTDAAGLRADLVVSTLPAGAADRYATRDWEPRQAVLDVAYDPWPSALAAAATAGGATVVSGALMLLHQAAEQVRLMTGLDAPVEAMRTALRAARPGCGA